MSDFVPFSRRFPQKSIESHSLVAGVQVELGPPREFRIQVLQTLNAVIGERRRVNWTRGYSDGMITPATIWSFILDAIAHEYGFFPSSNGGSDAKRELQSWFLREDQPNSYILSAIELSFRIVSKASRAIQDYHDEYVSYITLELAISDINQRFKQHDLHYYLDPESLMIRNIDSDLLHTEVVTQSLRLIRQSGFDGVESEFGRALEHHRHNRQEEAINDALKAFESAMKQICDERGWAYNPDKDTAKALINIVVGNGLVPKWVTEQFTQLRMILESGTPAIRNRNAGHGTGRSPRTVPSYVAAYALHTAAANIVFLIEAHRQQPR